MSSVHSYEEEQKHPDNINQNDPDEYDYEESDINTTAIGQLRRPRYVENLEESYVEPKQSFVVNNLQSLAPEQYAQKPWWGCDLKPCDDDELKMKHGIMPIQSAYEWITEDSNVGNIEEIIKRYVTLLRYQANQKTCYEMNFDHTKMQNQVNASTHAKKFIEWGKQQENFTQQQHQPDWDKDLLMKAREELASGKNEVGFYIGEGQIFCHIQESNNAKHMHAINNILYRQQGENLVLPMASGVFQGGFLEKCVFVEEVQDYTLEMIMTMRNVCLSLKEILYIMYYVCQGLSILHGLGLSHFDIRPDNIFFKKKPEALPYSIQDVRNFDVRLGGFEHVDTWLSPSAGGDPLYRAPEMWRITPDQPTFANTDIWQLGILFHYMLVGTNLMQSIQPLVVQGAGEDADKIWLTDQGEIALNVFGFSGYVDYITAARNQTVERTPYKNIDQNVVNLIDQMLKFQPFDRIDLKELIDSLGKLWSEIEQQEQNQQQQAINQQQQNLQPAGSVSGGARTPNVPDFMLDEFYDKKKQDLSLLKFSWAYNPLFFILYGGQICKMDIVLSKWEKELPEYLKMTQDQLEIGINQCTGQIQTYLVGHIKTCQKYMYFRFRLFSECHKKTKQWPSHNFLAVAHTKFSLSTDVEKIVGELVLAWQRAVLEGTNYDDQHEISCDEHVNRDPYIDRHFYRQGEYNITSVKGLFVKEDAISSYWGVKKMLYDENMKNQNRVKYPREKKIRFKKAHEQKIRHIESLEQGNAMGEALKVNDVKSGTSTEKTFISPSGVVFHHNGKFSGGSAGFAYRCVARVKAKGQNTDEIFVIKHVISVDIGNAADVEKQNMKLTQIIQNPYLVKIYDCFMLDNGDVALVLKGEHEDAQQLIEKAGTLTMDQALNIFLDTCRGLAGLHDHGMVHSDIKPDNIFTTCETGQCNKVRAVLGDLNLTGKCGGQDLRGTLSYMAPELCAEEQTMHYSRDIWALGATLHYLLTGYDPFLGNTYSQTVMAIASFQGYKKYIKKCMSAENEPPILETINGNEALLQLIDAMLNPDFTLRPTIHEVIEQTEKIMKDLEIVQNDVRKYDDRNTLEPGDGEMTSEEIENIMKQFAQEQNSKQPIKNLEQARWKNSFYLTLDLGGLSEEDMNVWDEVNYKIKRIVGSIKDDKITDEETLKLYGPEVSMEDVQKDEDLRSSAEYNKRWNNHMEDILTRYEQKLLKDERERQEQQEYNVNTTFVNGQNMYNDDDFNKLKDAWNKCEELKEIDKDVLQHATQNNEDDAIIVKAIAADRGVENNMETWREKSKSLSEMVSSHGLRTTFAQDVLIPILHGRQNQIDRYFNVYCQVSQKTILFLNYQDNDGYGSVGALCNDGNVEMVSMENIQDTDTLLALALAGCDYLARIQDIHFLVIYKKEYRGLHGTMGAQRRPFNIKETLCIMKDVCAGVKVLHDLNMVHTLINQWNVLVRFDGEKFSGGALAGYSYACKQQDLLQIRPEPFSAPEMYNSIYMNKAQKESDIWSLGVLMHYLLTGINPLQSVSDQIITSNIIRFMGYRKYIDKCMEAVPVPSPIKMIHEKPQIVNLINRMLQWHLHVRPDIDTLIKEIDELIVEYEVVYKPVAPIDKDQYFNYLSELIDERQAQYPPEGIPTVIEVDEAEVKKQKALVIKQDKFFDQIVSNDFYIIGCGWATRPDALWLIEGRMQQEWRSRWTNAVRVLEQQAMLQYGIQWSPVDREKVDEDPNAKDVIDVIAGISGYGQPIIRQEEYQIWKVREAQKRLRQQGYGDDIEWYQFREWFKQDAKQQEEIKKEQEIQTRVGQQVGDILSQQPIQPQQNPEQTSNAECMRLQATLQLCDELLAATGIQTNSTDFYQRLNQVILGLMD